MLKKILLASLAVGALALNAPAAMADDPTYDCGFNSLQQEATTGQNYEGAVYGVVAHPGDTNVTITCYVQVNGSPAGNPVTGSGPAGFAVAGGQVTFEATPEDFVELCAVATTSHGTTAPSCTESTSTQIPPQEVLDLINSFLEQVDPTICPIIALLAGNYVVIDINSEGDISINGGLFYDCPPYEIV